MKKLLLGLLIVGLMSAGFAFGVDYGQVNFRPQVVEVKVEVPVYMEVIKVVERIVIVEKVVTPELREFSTRKELKDWLAKDKTDVVVFKAQGIAFADVVIDCDEYAEDLVKAAEKDGYRISIQIDTKAGHALNNAFIGNNIYFIEPQTDKIWLEMYRD